MPDGGINALSGLRSFPAGSPPRTGKRRAAGQLAHPPSVHRQAQGQILRVGVKIVLRLQVAIRILGQIVLKQRQRGEDRQQPGAIVEDHLPQLAALAAVELVAEITLYMHQHVGVVFPRGGPLEDRHQLLAVDLEERFQILPFMQRGDERADLPVACLVVSQQLQLVAAVKGQQAVARQAAARRR